MTSRILQLLQERYSPDRGWILIPELRIGTGFGKDKEQRLDAWAICCWQTREPDGPAIVRLSVHTVAFEIKISRNDALQEFRNPDKRWHAHGIAHQFFFVAPQGVIEKEWLESDEGLLELRGDRLECIKQAAVRPIGMPRWTFVASIVRRLANSGSTPSRAADEDQKPGAACTPLAD